MNWCTTSGAMTVEEADEKERFIDRIADDRDAMSLDLEDGSVQRWLNSHLFVVINQDDTTV